MDPSGGLSARLALRRLDPLDPAGVTPVIDVLADAFAAYPVMRHILGTTGAEYGLRVGTLMRLFAMARVLRGEPIVGAWDGSALAGVALASFPDGPPSPPAFRELADEVWAEIGADARARYEAYGDACRPLLATVPHIHLNMIGVRREYQGAGVGRRLLDEVHALARSTPGAQGVTLTTEVESNVRLYEHVGYEVTGYARISPELETWAMIRLTT